MNRLCILDKLTPWIYPEFKMNNKNRTRSEIPVFKNSPLSPYWYTQYKDDGGKYVRVSLGTANYQQAYNKAIAIRDSIGKKLPPLEEFLSLYAEEMSFKNRALTKSTIKKKRNSLRLAPIVYSTPVSSMDEPFFQCIIADLKSRYIDKDKKEKYSSIVIAMVMKEIRGMLHFLFIKNIITKDMSHLVTQYKGIPQSREIPTPEFLREVNSNWQGKAPLMALDTRALVLTLATTGMRVGEALALTPACLKYDPDGGFPYLLFKDGKKKTKDRRVPVCKELETALRYIAPMDDHENKKNEIRYFPHNYTAYLNRLKPLDLNLTFHSYRKYYQTFLLGQGVEHAVVKLLMGHSLGAVEDVYTKQTAIKYKGIAELFSAMFAGEGQSHYHLN